MKTYVKILRVMIFACGSIHGDAVDKLASAFSSISSIDEKTACTSCPSKFLPADLKKIYDGIKQTVETEYKQGTYQQNYNTNTLFTKNVFLQTVQEFTDCARECLKKVAWLSGGTPDYLFVRKLVLPAGSVIEFRGDLHGDALSLIRWLDSLRDEGWFDKNNPFKIIKKGRYFAFLGDYTDRGHYGAENMFIIMQLFLNNPDKVLIVRGNHEDAEIVDRYGFVAQRKGLKKTAPGELESKFGSEFDNDKSPNSDQIKKVMDIFNYMPVALFLGCDNGKGGADFVQCCHGGMEPGYSSQALIEDPRKDLYQRINEHIDERKKVACALEKDMNIGVACSCSTSCDVGGFQWNDFDFENDEPLSDIEPNLRGSYDFHLMNTTELLKAATTKGSKNNVLAVFRAHQHTAETVPHILKYGNGIYKLWHGPVKPTDNVLAGFKHFIQWSGKANESVPLERYSVWTFNVAPRTGAYEKYAPKSFTYDTVARLELKPGFDNWTLYPRKIDVM